MCTDIFYILTANLTNGIQSSSTVLKDHGNLASAKFSPVTLGVFKEGFAVKENISAGNPARSGESPQNGTDHCRLSTSTLSYDADDLTLFHGKIKMFDRRNLISILYSQIFNFQHT